MGSLTKQSGLFLLTIVAFGTILLFDDSGERVDQKVVHGKTLDDVKKTLENRQTKSEIITSSKQIPNKSSSKMILLWHHIGQKNPPSEVTCHNNWKCHLSSDRTLAQKADALLLTFPYFDEDVLEIKRPRHQQWVFHSKESAKRMPKNVTSFNGNFNITMTYRLDSDIPIPYGKTARTYLTQPYKNYASGKTKMVAWFVSHCNEYVTSKRMEYAQELKKYIPVDIYGSCGSLNCSSNNKSACNQMLKNDYKFYLSFENAICKDYVTEKFWRIVDFDIVPIVLGGYDYAKYLPNKMVINVQDFDSPKALARYLIKLDKNDSLYNEYFRWKQGYTVRSLTGGFCLLCNYLFENENKHKIYDNIEQWWGPEQNCIAPSLFFKTSARMILD